MIMDIYFSYWFHLLVFKIYKYTPSKTKKDEII